MQTDVRSEELLRQQAILARFFHPTGEWEEFPQLALAESIVARFEEMVRCYPDQLAVNAGAEEITYAELNAAANRVAHAILAIGNVGAEPVIFLLEQGVEAIVTLLGILKSGNFYVALDPTHPPARNQMILADTGATLVITNHRQLPLIEQIVTSEQVVLNIDQLADNLPTVDPDIAIAPDAIAYLVYTSGTTGTPKGVIETHRNVLHFTRVGTNAFHLCPEDRLALTVSNSFSAAAAAIYPALLNGATLCPTDPSHQEFPGMSAWLRHQAITYFICIPAPYRQLIATLNGTEKFPNLRVILLGGDRIQPADIASYQQYFPPTCILRLGLGLSEKKLVAHYLVDHTTLIPETTVPVGYCVEETTVLLVDESDEPVTPGEIGEIVICSRYLSPGYWRQPQLTAARFRPAQHEPGQRLFYTGDMGMQRPDGCLVHIGRKDQQFKIRGVRVEIAEIEAALQAVGDWRGMAVATRANAAGEARLVAYLVPTSNPSPTVTTLRRRLAAILPAMMIPAAFVFLDALPLNENDKVNLHALPEPDRTRPALDVHYVAPRMPNEETLTAIWQDALEIEPVGVHDPFLDLGGDSLKAMRIVASLQAAFGVEIPLADMLASPTVADMALTLTAILINTIDVEL